MSAHPFDPAVNVPIIGIHKSPLSQKFGIPRQPNLVDVSTHIEMLSPYNCADAFVGIEEFSHLWIVWQFHQNNAQKVANNDVENTVKDKFRPQIRPPRLGGNKKIGVFASRSMYRPSSLGLSVVKLTKVTTANGQTKVHITGADMLDGTPIVDIKPYITYSDTISDAHCGYALTAPKAKQVISTQSATLSLAHFVGQQLLTEADVNNIYQLIAQDPRPAYKSSAKTEDDRVYVMRYGAVDIHFRSMSTEALEIVDLTKI